MEFINFVKYRDMESIAAARQAHFAHADRLRAQGELANNPDQLDIAASGIIQALTGWDHAKHRPAAHAANVLGQINFFRPCPHHFREVDMQNDVRLGDVVNYLP